MKNAFVILGDEDFQREKTTAVIDGIIQRTGGNKDNKDTFPQGQHHWGKIAEQIRTFSLFGTPKFFIIKDTEIFAAEEKIEALSSKLTQELENNEIDPAYSLLIKIIKKLEISGNDYDVILKNPSVLKTTLKDVIEKPDQIDAIFKKYALPPVLPEESSDFNFEELFSRIPEGHYVIITSKEWDKRTKIFKLFQKHTEITEQQKASQNPREQRKNIDAQLHQYITQINKKISKADAMLLSEAAYESLNVKASLAKLSIVVADKDTIAAEDIHAAFDDSLVPNMQNLPEMIRNRDIAKILDAMVHPQNTKPDFIKLTGYLRSLLKNAISILESTKELRCNDYHAFEQNIYSKLPQGSMSKQHPYYLFQCYLTFRGFKLSLLFEIYEKLFEIERELKTTQKKPQDLFVLFFVTLFNPKN